MSAIPFGAKTPDPVGFPDAVAPEVSGPGSAASPGAAVLEGRRGVAEEATRRAAAPPSLRYLILRRSLPLLMLVWGLMAAWAYQDALSQTNTLFDAAMVQSSEVLFSLAHHEMEEIRQVGPHQDDYAKPLTFQVWDDRGQLVFHSREAPLHRLSPLVNGFTDTTVDGEGWRVFAYHEQDDTMSLLIGEKLSVRHDLAFRLATRTMLPFALALPLIALVVMRSVRSSLAPTEQVVQHLSELAASRLEPVSGENVPLEIQPLVQAMNALFERLHEAYEHERRFTSDAAHELRTPLAALKVNAQVMLNGKLDADARLRLERVVASANRCEALVAQLLTLARLEQKTSAPGLRPIALAHLAHEVVSEMSNELLDKDIGIHLPALDASTEAVRVVGDPNMLLILLRNLLDNALRYSPAGGEVELALDQHAHGVTLSITDSGPGIAPELRERAFDRFFRIPGSQASGSGLGLSIVRRIADLHNAQLVLADAPSGRGLQVRIHFPGNEAES